AVHDHAVGAALAVDPVTGRELVAVDADHPGRPRCQPRVRLRGDGACQQAQGCGEEEGVLDHRIDPASAGKRTVSTTCPGPGVDGGLDMRHDIGTTATVIPHCNIRCPPGARDRCPCTASWNTYFFQRKFFE